MAHSNISIFVTHVGCPHLCAFCDQRTITGTADLPRGEDVRRICAEQLGRIKEPGDTEIAFFGGSFTAIERSYMTELLEAAAEFVGEGNFRGIRLSTRPDYIDREELVKKLYTDKKVRDGKLRFVIQKGIGEVVCFGENVFAKPIDEETAREMIYEL